MSEEQTAGDANQAAATPAAGGKGWLGKALIGLILLGGAGGAGWYFLLAPGGDEAATETAAAQAHKEPVYYTLADNLVVNFQATGGARFLQVSIDLMTFDEHAAAALDRHASVLRSKLILLLSDQTQNELMTREGKEVLAATALEEVRSTLRELHADAEIESLYFTSFVMQ